MRGYHNPMSPSRRTVIAGLVGCLAGILLAAVAAWVGVRGRGPGEIPPRDARLLAEVIDLIRDDYVDKTDSHQLMSNAIRGMVGELDPHSAFMNREEFEDLRIATEGNYSGIGVEVTIENDLLTVITPLDGSPAARAGIRAGDTILTIDGQPVRTGPLEDSIANIRGSPGTVVKLGIGRESLPQPLELTLVRAMVQVHSVRHALLEPGYGYLRISQFSETTGQDAEAAIRALEGEAGGRLRGLVLDLRNNPGGVLEAAVGVSDVFLDGGLIVTANGRAADAQFSMDAQPGDDLDGAPLVVLVNGGSASASEIVAGALQDHDRARLVGSQTYGKGSVQTVMPLSDGHAIKLTTSRYFTPSGASIHQRGIKPDVAVEDAKDGDDRALHVALGLLKDPGTIRHSSAK